MRRVRIVLAAGVVVAGLAAPAGAAPLAPDAPAARGGPPKVVAYYPSWATYGRDYQVADIPAGRLTHLTYAFADIADGRCVLGDPYADVDKAFPGDPWDDGALRGNFNQLRQLKARHPSLRTMIAIGGWTWSGDFPEVAATPASRAAFVDSCVDFMTTYGFDGIDVDWEFPVSGGLAPGTPADRDHYTALLADFRAALDARGAADGWRYDLSIAAPAGPTLIANLDVAGIARSVDWINLMAYDFHGGWEPRTGHNAPLRVGPADPSTGFSAADAVRTYRQRGMPARKIVLGVPFYGRGWTVADGRDDGLYRPATAMGTGTWEPGILDYTDIVENYLPRMRRHWDAAARVPYLHDPSTGLWISYDDPRSMAAKARFIRARGLGGAMIWEISGDRSYALLDSLLAGLGARRP